MPDLLHWRRAFVLACALCLTITAFAAVAPKSADELQAQATTIVTGKVIVVTSKLKLKSLGTAADRIYLIKVKIATVTKGSDLQAGDTITIRAWRPSYALMPTPGPQGHSNIPTVGAEATFHLTGRGSDYQPIMPNGIQPPPK